MALVLKCDRCKKQYPDPVDPDNALRNLPEGWATADRYHLCPDCYRDFHIFMLGQAIPRIDRSCS